MPPLCTVRVSIDLFQSAEIDADWAEDAPRINDALAATSLYGSVNPGDGRAIYYLVRGLKPWRLLEVGTHIGGSTVHIAAAMQRNVADGINCRLTTVDVKDVNGREGAPWQRAGLGRPPRDNVALFGMSEGAEFIHRRSAQYFETCSEAFDFIFVDGNHSEEAAYSDVRASLQHLKPGGLLLLHDFFPNRAPLWSNGNVIPGPFMACERLRDEGWQMVATPLGALPWPTKLGSNVTSLAIVSA